MVLRAPFASGGPSIGQQIGQSKFYFGRSSPTYFVDAPLRRPLTPPILIPEGPYGGTATLSLNITGGNGTNFMQIYRNGAIAVNSGVLSPGVRTISCVVYPGDVIQGWMSNTDLGAGMVIVPGINTFLSYPDVLVRHRTAKYMVPAGTYLADANGQGWRSPPLLTGAGVLTMFANVTGGNGANVHHIFINGVEKALVGIASTGDWTLLAYCNEGDIVQAIHTNSVGFGETISAGAYLQFQSPEPIARRMVPTNLVISGNYQWAGYV